MVQAAEDFGALTHVQARKVGEGDQVAATDAEEELLRAQVVDAETVEFGNHFLANAVRHRDWPVWRRLACTRSWLRCLEWLW